MPKATRKKWTPNRQIVVVVVLLLVVSRDWRMHQPGLLLAPAFRVRLY
jgi:hypothetical protein